MGALEEYIFFLTRDWTEGGIFLTEGPPIDAFIMSWWKEGIWMCMILSRQISFPQPDQKKKR
jgi:hypothetical protein